MNIQIRKAKLSDIKEIALIFREGFLEKPYNETWSEKDAIKKIKDYFNWAKIYVAEKDKKVVGFIIYHDFLMFDGLWRMVAELVIDKKFRKQGIGKLLMTYTENDSQIKKIWLSTNKNSDAFNFYKKLRYNESGWVTMEKKK